MNLKEVYSHIGNDEVSEEQIFNKMFPDKKYKKDSKKAQELCVAVKKLRAAHGYSGYHYRCVRLSRIDESGTCHFVRKF